MRDCKCGCGKKVLCSYFRGHNRRGLTKQTDESTFRQSEKIRGNTNVKGFKWSFESVKKLSLIMKGKTPWNKGLTKETDERVKSANWGRKTGTLGLKRSEGSKRKQREMVLRKMKDGTWKIPTIWFNTYPERLVEQELLNQGCMIVKQFHSPVGLVDFYLPDENVVVEVDGDYWHNYPNGTEKDREKTKCLIEKGFRVVRFWERDIRKDVRNCIARIV